MASIAFERNDTDPIADHPVIKQIIADVKGVQAQQAKFELRQANFEQASVLANDMMRRIHSRQEALDTRLSTIEQQNRVIIDTSNQILEIARALSKDA